MGAIRKRDTAEDQYGVALTLLNDEEAWRAVVDYHQNDTIYRPKAMVQLAFLYLRTGRQDEAETLLIEIERMGEKDNFLMPHAMAGKAIMASLNEDYQASDRIIRLDLNVNDNELIEELNQEVRLLIQVAIGKNSAARGEEINQELLQLFDYEMPDSNDTGM